MSSRPYYRSTWLTHLVRVEADTVDGAVVALQDGVGRRKRRRRSRRRKRRKKRRKRMISI